MRTTKAQISLRIDVAHMLLFAFDRACFMFLSFYLPLGVGDWLRSVTVALLGIFIQCFEILR